MMSFQTYYLFGLRTNLTFLAFVFCGTLCSYNFHWYLTSPAEGGAFLSVKNSWNLNNRRLHAALALAFFLLSLMLFVLLRQHFLWLAVAGTISFLYSAPKIRSTRWLRHIAYGKTIFLALAWTYITAILPLQISLTYWDQPHILFCINRFFLIYGICILFDLRDREEDRIEGIRSLVTQLPLPAVLFIFRSVMVVFLASGVLLMPDFSFPVIAALIAPGLIVFVLHRWFQTQRSDLVYYFVLDGLMAFSLPLLLVFGF